MLRSTFIHVPGIGPKTELRFWESGLTDWESFRQGYRGRLRERVLDHLNEPAVLTRLPKSELWRLYGLYRDRTAFVDIETTGLYGDVTCIGVWDGKSARTFVLGRDLEEFPAAMKGVEFLVTFNGIQFDVPILQRAFPGLRLDELPHLDLRFGLRRLGLRGGLKRIERALGVERGGVEGLDGWTAVEMWRLHRRGHRTALQTLERYCLEDVLNLDQLACVLYNEMTSRVPFPVAPLELLSEPSVSVQADPDLVDWLLNRAVPW